MEAKMNNDFAKRMRNGSGFIAALDQSGGSTPKALSLYGVTPEMYATESEMFDLMHEMRTRIITSPTFTSERILAAIIFEMTMERQIDGMYTAQYLSEKKGIVPFLKIDNGLLPVQDGVALMKDIPELDARLSKATAFGIFGTKERSVIKELNESGIAKVVKQQFEVARRVIDAGLVPIIEPEVDINAPEKSEIEAVLKGHLFRALSSLSSTDQIIFKLTIPTVPNFYHELSQDSHVMRIVALSGGYSRSQANSLLVQNSDLIASFSRALTEGLLITQSQSEFDAALDQSIEAIYRASTKKE